jgi:three-Cys-motif partner protein
LLALSARHPFTDYYFADKEQPYIDALKTRCSASPLADRIRFEVGDANELVSSLAEDLRRTPSLNLAFLDPEGLELAWDCVATLATVGRLDLIIHYPQTGLNRYMPIALDQAPPTLVDRFFGEERWREVYRTHMRGEDSFLHRHLIDAYKAKLAALGYADVRSDNEVGLEPAMLNEKGVPLYRLLFASKHPLGMDFWRKITSKDARGQRRLPL